MVPSLKGSLHVDDFKFNGPLGSAGASIELIERNHFRVILDHAPNHPEWPNKLQFTINQNAKGNDLRLDVCFHDHREMPFNEYFCSWSYDGQEWNPIQWQKGNSESSSPKTLVFPMFECDRVFVGHQVPMTYENVQKLLDDWESHPYAQVQMIGQSLQGRKIRRLVISKPSTHESQKRSHYFAAQHPGEHNAGWRMAGMIDWLLSQEAETFLDNHICHFVLMMSPDSPSQGWYRVNSEGVDMNRTYVITGSDKEKQTHEAWVCQHDLEQIARKSSLMTTWAMHTWGGKVETIIQPSMDMEKRYSSWMDLKESMIHHDPLKLCKPLSRAEKHRTTSWGSGPYYQFGVTTFLCEGSGGIYTKSENMESGKALIKGLADYCSKTV